MRWQPQRCRPRGHNDVLAFPGRLHPQLTSFDGSLCSCAKSLSFLQGTSKKLIRWLCPECPDCFPHGVREKALAPETPLLSEVQAHQGRVGSLPAPPGHQGCCRPVRGRSQHWEFPELAAEAGPRAAGIMTTAPVPPTSRQQSVHGGHVCTCRKSSRAGLGGDRVHGHMTPLILQEGACRGSRGSGIRLRPVAGKWPGRERYKTPTG